MRIRMAIFVLVSAAAVSAANAQTKQPTWTQLSLSTCRVDEFLKNNPKADGRGVVIAVMDTGVDPSIPGLTETPDGGVKVIDVQDFTGQGDVELHRVRRGEGEHSGSVVDYNDDGAPIHYTLPDLPRSTKEERRYWLGTFAEKKFVNSDLPDLNDNDKTDDEWPVLVTALEGDGDDQAVVYVDTDLDRDFSDEKKLRNYRLEFDTFTLGREKPEEQIVPVTFGLNVFLRKPKVVMYYDDGAHGTHVAGIAAGYKINNQAGFNGVAPGAKVMGLKIGKGDYGGISSTDAKKKALEFVGRYAREHDVPVVCNLSYGVESVIEGHSDIDKFIDGFLVEHPEIVYCTSAGNEGPGLSSVGTPAAADQVISVAALLAAESARDVMGFDLPHSVLTVFSSRGGELNKPNVATPGWSTSTVPRYVTRGDFWAGTSMASPYAAGLCALLISDAQQKHPDADIRAWDVRRALQLSGRPVEGFDELDFGYGVPDMVKAAELLDRILAGAKDDPVIGYDISTPSPHGYEGESPAAYWRGTYFPSLETHERQTFTIKPVFAPEADASARTSFSRRFDLRTDTPWIDLEQKQTYLRSEQTAQVYVRYDASKLTEPGVHVGAVEAVRDGLVEFRLMNTVIVPYTVDAADDFSVKLTGQEVKGWIPNRHFFAVPPGASSMVVKLEAPEGKTSQAAMDRIFDPTGSQLRAYRRLDTADGVREVAAAFSDELMPGVWEVPVVSTRPNESWPYELSVQFFGLHAAPKEVTDWSGSTPKGDIVVTNTFARPQPTRASGQLEGFRMYKEDKFEGLKDELSYHVDLHDSCDKVRLDLELTPEAYAEVTDIGVYVEVGGESIFTDAFSNRKLTATVPVKGKSSFDVVIRGGFAVSDDKRETPITVKIDQLLSSPISIGVTHADSSSINFIPSIPTRCEYKLSDAPPEAPDGYRPVGYLSFSDRQTGTEALRVPIDIGAE